MNRRGFLARLGAAVWYMDQNIDAVAGLPSGWLVDVGAIPPGVIVPPAFVPMPPRVTGHYVEDVEWLVHKSRTRALDYPARIARIG